MTTRQMTSDRGEEPTGNLATLGSERRRVVLATLARQDAPVDERRLARLVVAAERDGHPDDVDGDDVEDVSVSLHHSHLPALVDAGLVDREPDGSVRAVDDDLDPAALTADEPGVGWDVLAALAREPQRGAALAVLAEAEGPTTCRELAASIVAREVEGDAPAARRGDDDDESLPMRVGRVATSLHHRDLPVLDDLGLVSYDPGENRVTLDRRGLPAVVGR